MGYEKTSGLNVHNHYGPRVSGGEQGVYKTFGMDNEYVINLPLSGLDYKFVAGRNFQVYEVDDTFVKGSLSALAIGGVSVLSASASAPVKIAASNSGVVTQTGGTGGYIVIRYKNVAEEIAKLVDSVDVAPATASVEEGATVQLTATVAPDSADQRVGWSSSDEAKATVDANGLVTGVAAGSATITATSSADSSKTDTCSVTVTAA